MVDNHIIEERIDLERERERERERREELNGIKRRNEVSFV